jgi:hypothetical protein
LGPAKLLVHQPHFLRRETLQSKNSIYKEDRLSHVLSPVRSQGTRAKTEWGYIGLNFCISWRKQVNVGVLEEDLREVQHQDEVATLIELHKSSSDQPRCFPHPQFHGFFSLKEVQDGERVSQRHPPSVMPPPKGPARAQAKKVLNHSSSKNPRNSILLPMAPESVKILRDIQALNYPLRK